MEAPLSNTTLAFWLVGSYLLGSVSFARLITRIKSGVDLRTVGSGNLGATNAGRVLGRRWGLFIYALDCAKGLGPVFAARSVGDESVTDAFVLPLSILVGAATIVGHCLPVMEGFRGGKGVATTSGVLAGLCPGVFGIAMLVFGLALATTRMISVGSMLGGLALPIAWLALERRHALEGRGAAVLTLLLLMMTLILVMHRKNMERIVRGEEPKLGRGPKT